MIRLDWIRLDAKGKKRAKIAGIVLGILCVVGLVGFTLLVKSCLYFDAEGAHVKDRFGILEMEKQSGVEQDAEDQPQTQQTPAYEDVKVPVLHALTADAEQMANEEAYMAELESAGWNGAAEQLLVNFKDADGKVCFELDSRIVSGVQASFAGWFHYAIEEANTAGLEVYAVLHCFRDTEAVENAEQLAVRTADGTVWTDPDGSSWLDPTAEAVQDYLTELVEQSVEQGAQEIILRDFAFPDTEDALTYAEQNGDRSEQLMRLYSRLQRTAGEIPVSIWLEDADADSETTGQDLRKMYRNAYRLYVPAEDTDEAQKLAEQIASRTGGSAHFVPVFAQSEAYDLLPGGAVCALE